MLQLAKGRPLIIKLSARLQAIAAMVLPGKVIADIGTDHAYLPVYLVSAGTTPRAVAVEVNQGPYAGALAQVKMQGLTAKIDVRLGDGLAPVARGEVEVAVLAGMGGSTITGILVSRPEVVGDLQQLVLQPMVGAAHVRRWLLHNGWMINDEKLVEEDKHLYIIISAVPGQMMIEDWLTMELGPVILKQRPPLLAWQVAKLVEDYRKVAVALNRSLNSQAGAKRALLLEKINLLEDLRHDLKMQSHS